MRGRRLRDTPQVTRADVAICAPTAPGRTYAVR